MPSPRDIQRRIRSISNTKKMTRAMEQVAAAKMRRSVQRAAMSREYAHLAWEVFEDLFARAHPAAHPLFTQRPMKKVAVVLVSANRGLCGAYNAKVAAEAAHIAKKIDADIDFVTMGTKGAHLVSHSGAIAADFEKPDVTQRVDQILPLAQFLIAEYEKKTYDAVFLVYTDYVSALQQIPRVKKILPAEQHDQGLPDSLPKKNATALPEYTFEPSAEEVLVQLVPRLIELQLYQACVESDASEHASRMVAMKNATDSAQTLIDELRLAFNKARQAAITSEIAEITSGRMAVRN